MTAIGFVGFGEVASRLSATLSRHGAKLASYDVLLNHSGGIDTLNERVGDVPVEFVPLQELMARSNIVLSAVTTDAALDAAKACAAHLSKRHIYVDLNAASPAIKRSIAKVLKPSGVHFVEGAILNAIDVAGARTRVLVCGDKAKIVADTLTQLGLNVGFYGAEIGRASTFKLLRSIFSKGMEALLLETLLAARRAGVEDEVWREIVTTLDEQPFKDVGGNWMRTHGRAHSRRYHEMIQVEALVSELGIEPLMTHATTTFFERSTRLALSSAFRHNPLNQEEVLGALEKLLSKIALDSKAKGDPRCGQTQ